jgi:tetratricopeptide (TPR) repeat protein
VRLFRKFKIWRELKRLEARVRAEPSPTTFVDLGQVYINLGMIDDALRVAEEGLALFPNAEELRKLRKYTRKNKINARIRAARTRLNSRPDAALYRELAGLYLELGDLGAVVGTCEEGLRRYDKDVGLLFLLGKARLTVFYRDLIAREGLAAVEALERVLQAEPDHAQARQLLVELLYRVGALGHARPHLQYLQRKAPQDSEIVALAASLAANEAPAEGNLDVLFHDAESTATLMSPPAVKTRVVTRVASEGTIGTIRETLSAIAEIAGVRKAAYIRGTRALVKGEIRDGRDAFLRIVRVVTKAAQRVARRMDIGSFNKGTIEGGFGHICICSFGDVVSAVLCDQGTQTDRVLNELQDLVANSLYLEGAERT